LSLSRKWLFLREVKIDHVLADASKFLADQLVVWMWRISTNMFFLHQRPKARDETLIFGVLCRFASGMTFMMPPMGEVHTFSRRSSQFPKKSEALFLVSRQDAMI
jgi:hypothetical protein